MSTNLINEITLEYNNGQVNIVGVTENAKQLIEQDKPYFDDISTLLTQRLDNLIKDYSVTKRWRESRYNG